MPNKLINETSPYLLQHANNPVDWYPWGEEALKRAEYEDKPILLSIGYSACHWCHVMERESFEDPDIAGLMNEHYICIKVDREERPDLDSLYMSAVQALTGSGGWPMTMFLMSDGKPFYGGTYFPPVDSGGMPGFARVLLGVAEAYRDRRGDVLQSTQQLISHLEHLSHVPAGQEPLTSDIMHQAYQGMVGSYDFENGGLGDSPKFPQPMSYEFMLRYHKTFRDDRALEMVEMALEQMAKGGIYDQIGGGFHRYSTDARWLVPHFEKMLYDNALLSLLYLHTFQTTRNPFYRRIVEETLDYVLREMTDPMGGFYSTQDADSEGVEGKFFVWTPEEIQSTLGVEDAGLLEAYFGVSDQGNFDGKNILHVAQDPQSFTAEVGVSAEDLQQAITRGRVRLLKVREERIHPARDEKVISAWNGLMLRSFAEAASVLGRKDYLDAAISCASFLKSSLRQDERLLRTYKDGRASLKGYLEDYSFLSDGLLALYEATFDSRWLDDARTLVDEMLDLFWDDERGVFYDTGSDHERLVIRPRDFFDNATPSGSSVAADVLLRMFALTGEEEYGRRGSFSLRSMQQYLSKAPLAMGHWLCTLDFYLATPKEIAFVGGIGAQATRALLNVVHGRYMPNKVLAGSDPDSDRSHRPIPLLEDKYMVDNRPTAYVCEDSVCQPPVTEPEALEALLGD